MITPEQIAGESEDSQQLALMCWAALNYNKYPELKRLVHIPNGGFRNKREAAKLKAMGVKRGFPDLFLPIGRGEWFSLFIELKKIKDGVLSSEQKDWIAFLKAEGYAATVCNGWLEARDTLISYLEWK